MSNRFLVYWKPNTSAANIACLVRQLEAIGPGPVDQEDDYIDADVDWKTDRKSVNNLKGRLNNNCNNCVADIEVDDDSDSSDSSSSSDG